MWASEFVAYATVKNYFKYCLKEYVFRIVGVDIKTGNVRAKLKKQFKQLHVDATACLTSPADADLLARLNAKSADAGD